MERAPRGPRWKGNPNERVAATRLWQSRAKAEGYCLMGSFLILINMLLNGVS